MAKSKKGRGPAQPKRSYSVETWQQSNPGQKLVRQVIIKTQQPVFLGKDFVTLFRKPRGYSQQKEIDRLEPLGRGIVVGILARRDVKQIKLKRNRAYVTLEHSADFGQERDAADRIVGAQVAYFT